MNSFYEGIFSGSKEGMNILLPPEPVKIFLSYAREDQAFRKVLGKHLMPLVRAGFVALWDDGDVQPGTELVEEIYSHLNAADIILLLVSPDFMSSDFCYYVELPRVLERHALEEVGVIAILLRPTYWKGTEIDKFQVLPRGERAVSTWRNRDQAFFDIVKDIFEEITLLISQRWLERSNVFYETKDYGDALQACEQAILLSPKNVSAYLSRGALLWHLERYEEALEAYEQVILLDLNNVVAHMSKCYVLWVLGRYQLALQACEQAILLHPENTVLYLFKGQLHELLRDQAYQKARQLGYGKGNEYLRDKRLIMGPKDAFSFFEGNK